MAQNISNRVDKLEASSFELSAKTLSLENDSNKEKVALKFVVVTNAENCPDGWTSQGVVGWIMHNPDYSNNVGKGEDSMTTGHGRILGYVNVNQRADPIDITVVIKGQ